MLRELALRHPSIGDVRGAGLFIGVELVRPDGSPDEDLALHVVNGLRERHVLLGTAGLHNNVLKVRPPSGLLARPTRPGSPPSSRPRSPLWTPDA